MGMKPPAAGTSALEGMMASGVDALLPLILHPSACSTKSGATSGGQDTHGQEGRRVWGMVGARGFEPPTPWSRTRCSTRLSHAPTGQEKRRRFSLRLTLHTITYPARPIPHRPAATPASPAAGRSISESDSP